MLPNHGLMELNIYPPLPRRKDFRIGILGSGFIVNDCHLVAYRKAGFNPVAIASRTSERAREVAQRHHIPKVHDHYEALLADPSIEVLDLAVPPNAQLALIEAACARKTVKGILAQKPLGMNFAEAVEAVRVCEAAGITLAVNQNMRYDHSVRAGKTLLENGAIGEPVFATIEMRGIPHWMPWQKDLGWLTLRIMSIHHLDTFRYWFGDPEGIYCSVRTDPRTQFEHIDGICTYILEYQKGLRGVGIDDTWTGPAKEGCASDIYIKWRIEGLNGLAIGDIGWCKDPYTTPSTIRYASKGSTHFESPVWAESWFPDAFIGTMAQLLIALEDGSEPAISGRDNLKTMALVEAAYMSAAQFRSVAIDEITGPIEDHKSKPLPAILKGYRSNLISAPLREPHHDNFTPRALTVLALARQEAERMRHSFVGTEHLLLGLLRLGVGIAVKALLNQGVSLEKIRESVEQQIGQSLAEPCSVPGLRIPYTPRTKKVLSLAGQHASALNHIYVGTEHILLAMLAEGNGVAAHVLTKMGVEMERTRHEILKELDPNFGSDPRGRAS